MADEAGAVAAARKRALEMLPQEMGKRIYNVSIVPRPQQDGTWIYARDVRGRADLGPDGERSASAKGKRFTRVRADGTREPVCDHERLARELSAALEKPMVGDDLPLSDLRTGVDGAFLFTCSGAAWRFDLGGNTLERLPEHAHVKQGELRSPDGRLVAYVENHNVFVRNLETGEVRQLTHDGVRHFDYATVPECNGSYVGARIHGRHAAPAAVWSPDSTRLFTHRTDQRLVRELHVHQFAPEGEALTPVLHTLRYALPGDPHVPEFTLLILGLDGSRVDLDTRPLEMSALQYTPFDAGNPFAWWRADGECVYWLRVPRGCQRTDLCVADTASGQVNTIFSETSSAFMQLDHVARGAGAVLLRGGRFLWLSGRSGWQQLYMGSEQVGSPLRQLTQGQWVVHAIHAVDEDRGIAYVIGSGREPDRHPYYKHLYAVSIDDGAIKLLTPENADHTVTMLPGNAAFVDTHSRVDRAPVTVLRRADGELVTVIEEADIADLVGAGYVFPEPFVAKGADGETDIHGVLIRPANFDPNKRYPVIDYAYGGVHIAIAPTSFAIGPTGHDRMHTAQSLAQLGFVVVSMDGRGTPGRSEAFYHACHRHLGDCAGLYDHVAATKNLAKQFPFVDIERVGMFGFSGGGYGSARALLEYPDFYKVGVASCGDHDNRLYSVEWAERYQGLYDEELYAEQASARLADRLQGKLLLMHGDIDDNVYLHNTMRLVDALIKADRDFDMLILPNRGHGLGGDPYVIRRIWDYFLAHL
jgi:dipeptidyl aminopeptidase/acylaminoacyl peptidase